MAKMCFIRFVREGLFFGSACIDALGVVLGCL